MYKHNHKLIVVVVVVKEKMQQNTLVARLGRYIQ